MNENEITGKTARAGPSKANSSFVSTNRWKLFITSILYPTAVLMFFYTRNSAYVPLRMLLLTCGVLIVITSIIWWLSYLYFRFPLSAFVLCTLEWTAIFALSLLLNAFPSFVYENHETFQWILLLVSSFALLAIFSNKLCGKDSTRIVSLFLSVFISVFFLFNLYGTLRTTKLEDRELNRYIKTEYNVSTRQNKPDVYWIHCDGMIDFSVMDQYFGDAQKEFRQALIARGFMINKNAELESGHSTTAAIPALMCPNFYDNYLSALLFDHDAAHDTILKESVQQHLKRARLNNEFIHAFEAGGYSTFSIGIVEQFLFPTTDKYYYPVETEKTNYFLSKENLALAVIEDMSDETAVKLIDTVEIKTFLNTVCKPFGILLEKVLGSHYLNGLYYSESKTINTTLPQEKITRVLLSGEAANKFSYMVNALALTINEDKPKLTIILDFIAHRPFIYDEYGNIIENADNMNVNNYPAQYDYAEKALLNMIDLILEKDPNAVIILQGDHGLHENSAEDFKEAFGDDFSTIDLWNSVLSCYRIPEAYQIGDEAEILSNPLNVSRYLINNFVGANYDYVNN